MGGGVSEKQRGGCMFVCDGGVQWSIVCDRHHPGTVSLGLGRIVLGAGHD